MPRGRPPLPPDQRRPRRSGPRGAPVTPSPEEQATQRERLHALRAQLGGPLGPCSVAALARVLSVAPSRLARLGASEPLAVERCRPATLLGYEQAVSRFLAGEDVGQFET